MNQQLPYITRGIGTNKIVEVLLTYVDRALEGDPGGFDTMSPQE